jgi:SAM-dependent methyltransferase
VAAEPLHPPDLSTPGPEHASLTPPFVIASGEKAKARHILTAIRAVKRIENECRPATHDERQALARFAGFGPVALSIFPDPVTGRYKDATWQQLGEELKSLLSPEEYDSAKRTTFNAFYTSPTVIAAMHEAITRLGVPRNATILEPGCGTGNFLSYGQAGTRFIGVELDRFSGRIAQLLHPDQDIRIENFRDTRLPEDRIDAVIGNVPFADLKLEYAGQKLSLHDYFFAKSIDALKPGGVLALVTTHFTLDKQNAALREYLAAKADFVGAIRLPSDAFKREHHGPRAILNAVEHLANAYATECARVRQDLGIAESQLRDYQARLGKPFLHDAYLYELTTLRDLLKAGLSGTAPEPRTESYPSISELAERIKALKTANTIEATPERVDKRHFSAEEPVTARLRRRTQKIPEFDA